jgi:hypothetical protein
MLSQREIERAARFMSSYGVISGERIVKTSRHNLPKEELERRSSVSENSSTDAKPPASLAGSLEHEL